MRPFVLPLLLLPFLLMAQPDTDIYLLSVSSQGDQLVLSDSKNITPRKGYDNQPCFTPDGKGLLYVAAQLDGQTEVYRYDLGSGSSKRLTQTKKRSEYSPTVMPDGEHISVVVVEEDSSQRIWAVPLEGGAGKRLTDKVEFIGYYAWYHKKKMAAFLLGDVFTLQCFHVKKQKPQVLAENIGRAVQIRPTDGAVSFVQKGEATPWKIRSWHPKTKDIQDIVPVLDGSEDYCWTPEGHLLMGKGSELFRFRPGIDQDWQSLGALGVGDFYRLAMSPDGKNLAVVVFKGDKP
ncbi:MAG: hypothetical protein AAF587_35695 [Bacteroidota bacterium]